MASLNNLFTSPVKVINVGLASFFADLKSQGVTAVQVDWQPPAGGNAKVAALLDRVRRWQTLVRAGKE
ncbi:MAG: fdrA domain protein [Candidatus Riflebacteria bacterium]|nr:fdrA domain protein [Candidatus Riflebacteria bacterium]